MVGAFCVRMSVACRCVWESFGAAGVVLSRFFSPRRAAVHCHEKGAWPFSIFAGGGGRGGGVGRWFEGIGLALSQVGQIPQWTVFQVCGGGE